MPELSSLRLDLSDKRWSTQPEQIVNQIIEANAPVIEIDASGAGPLRTQVCQILLAIGQTTARQDGGFVIRDISDEARRSLETLGLADVLIGGAA